jgi:hypothetical protein
MHGYLGLSTKNTINQQGYAFGHFGDSSSHVDLASIHPSPGKKSER